LKKLAGVKKLSEMQLWPMIINSSVRNINNKITLLENETIKFIHITTMIIDGRYDDALKEINNIDKDFFEKYIDIFNYIYSMIYLKTGDLSRALDYVKKIKSLDDDRYKILYGDILLLNGDFSEAEMKYKSMNEVKLKEIRLSLCELVAQGFTVLKSHDDLIKKCVDIFKGNNYKLKITYLPIVNGVTGGMKIIYEHINRLQDRGHEVDAISYFDKPDWFDLKVNIKRMGIDDDFSKYIKNTDAIIYTFWNQWYQINHFDNTLFLVQGDEFLFDDCKLSTPLQKAIASSHLYSESKFLAVSHFLIDTIYKKYNRKCQLINNAIDVEKFNNIVLTNNDENKQKLRIIIVGNAILKFKGFEDIFKAFDIVKSRGYDFDVTWITQSQPGNCPDYIDIYINPPQNKIPDLYREADIYICGSHYEAFSLPPLEAMAAGCAVITTNNGGVSEYAKDGYNCLMSDVGDYRGLAENIIKLLHDEDLRMNLIKNGYETVNNYTWDKAIDLIEEVFIYQYLDVKPIKSSDLKTNTLSLCIITKDEEKNIARCINSVKDIVDEIVVVDTGSKDKTVDIAKSLGARVIHMEWEDDFSKARNTAIDNAKSDWILFLDADEVVRKEDVEKIRPLLNDDTVEAYLFKFINYGGDSVSNRITQIHYNFKLFRNNGKLRYVYPIHENLKNVVHNRDLIYKDSGVTILHYGYLSETRIEKNKTRRYIDLMSKYLLKHPNDKFQHLNLGVEYFNAKEYDKALKHLKIAEKWIDSSSSLRIRLLRYLILTYTELKNYDAALELANSAKATFDKIADFYFLEGNIYVEQKRYQKAIEAFNKCLAIGEYKGTADVLGGTGSFRAKYMIAFCNEKLGKLQEAVNDYVKLLIAVPGYKEAFIKLFEILVANETPEAVREFFDKYVDKSDPENYAILAKLYMNIGRCDIAMQYLDEIRVDVEGLNNFKGMAYMGLKRFKEALECFDKEYGKSRSAAKYYATICYIILKEFEQAKDIAWKLDNPNDKKLFLTLIGKMRVGLEEVRDSFFQLLEFLLIINEFDLFNDVLNLYVNDFSREDYVKYGKMMQDRGLEELALKSYFTAAERNCQDAHVYRYLAQKASENGMYDEAFAMAAKALNLDNKDVENYVLIYNLYKAVGNNAEAEQINKAVKTLYDEIDLSRLNNK